MTSAHAQEVHLGERVRSDHRRYTWCEVVMEEEELCQSVGRETRGQRSCHVPCFKCWRTRIPPPWLVVCAAILVQVFISIKSWSSKTCLILIIKSEWCECFNMYPPSYRLDLVSIQSLSRNLLVMITPTPTSSVSIGVYHIMCALVNLMLHSMLCVCVCVCVYYDSSVRVFCMINSLLLHNFGNNY